MIPRSLRGTRIVLAVALFTLAVPFVGCDPLDAGDDAVAVSIILD